MILLLDMLVLHIVLLLLPIYTAACSSKHIQMCVYNNGVVLAEDEGKLDTELTFSCNSWNATTSIDCIYSTPAMQAENDGFLNSQLVL